MTTENDVYCIIDEGDKLPIYGPADACYNCRYFTTDKNYGVNEKSWDTPTETFKGNCCKNAPVSDSGHPVVESGSWCGVFCDRLLDSVESDGDKIAEAIDRNTREVTASTDYLTESLIHLTNGMFTDAMHRSRDVIAACDRITLAIGGAEFEDDKDD